MGLLRSQLLRLSSSLFLVNVSGDGGVGLLLMLHLIDHRRGVSGGLLLHQI